MLDPVIIIPQAQRKLASDVSDYIQLELYGIDKCPKTCSQLLASAVIQIALNANPTTAQQQCLLSALLTIK